MNALQLSRWLFLVSVLILSAHAARSASSQDLLPNDDPWTGLPGGDYDPQVPTPEKFLGGGYRAGQRHLHYHELLAYLDELDRVSPRFTSFEYARSYGGRPLKVYVVTSLENHARLTEIEAERRRWRNPDIELPNLDAARPPLAIYMGYNVHGNEASGGNAAPLVAYHLAASQAADVEQWLRDTVIMLDPCLNPDGFERFACWVNQNRSLRPHADPLDREHRETWPGGRTNYYWFDLNRDWLPAQHPESHGRLQLYQRWHHDVVLDFHEMGTQSTFFFQPGVPRRKHPLIPDTNVRLTEQLGAFHAASLDRAGSLYFTEEVFDDFYPGKGSTYADLHGSVGILFEQASSRGFVQEFDFGRLTFGSTVRNQVLTSISSLRGSLALRKELQDYQREFYRAGLAAGRDSAVKAHIYSAPDDPQRLAAFRTILTRHGIASHPLREDLVIDGVTFRRDDALVVPTAQPEYVFLMSLIEQRTQFTENVFYDVSAWTLPLAFNLTHAAVERDPAEYADLDQAYEPPARTLAVHDDDLAYLVDWRGYYAPRTLQRLLQSGILVQAARSPVTIGAENGAEVFPEGSLLVVTRRDNAASDETRRARREQIQRILQTAAEQDGVRIAAARSFLTPSGPDLGSTTFSLIPRAEVALLVGNGVRASEAGEAWHLLDRRFQVPATLLDQADVGSARLSRYTTIVMPSGRYSGLSAADRDKLKAWVQAGGTLIAIGSSASWVAETQWVPLSFRNRSGGTSGRRPFAAAADDAALQRIAGVILHSEADTTHPLCYGIGARLATFRDHTLMLDSPQNSLTSPLIYTSEPLLGGYASRQNVDTLRSSAAAQVHPLGAGRLVLLLDDPNFRAFWYGSNRLFLNAIFYGPLMKSTGFSENELEE